MLRFPFRCVRHMTMCSPAVGQHRRHWPTQVTVGFAIRNPDDIYGVFLNNPNPEPTLVAAVKKYAAAWAPFANIKFEFVPSWESTLPDIPIVFVDLPEGSSTTPGAFSGSPMFLEKGQFLNGTITEAELGRVIMHEFGHSMGAGHEHQRPDNGITWKEVEVNNDFDRRGRRTKDEYDGDLVRSDVCATNPINDLPAEHMSPYDRLSIMHYPLPAGYTTDNARNLVPPNMFLSKWDKAWIARYYPYPQRKIMNFPFSGLMRTRHAYSRGLTNNPKITFALAGLETAVNKDPHVSMGADDFQRTACRFNLKVFDEGSNARATYLETASDDPAFQANIVEAVPDEHGIIDHSQDIQFTTAFFEPDPVVVVWLNSIHSTHGHPTKIKTYTSNITTNGFRIHVNSTENSRFRSATVSWVAYPKDMPGTQTGNIAPANTARNLKVPFTDGNLTRTSNVLFAVNELAFATEETVTFRVTKEAITDHAMDLKVDPHVGATYLAIDTVKGPLP